MGAALVQARVLSASDREVPIFRIMRKKSPTICNPRTADRLLPYHDSQFSAFSTEVLRPAELGHNRSSSPGAALADDTEHKAAKHRSRANPTFDQRHDSELMHIRPNSRRRTLLKVFGLYNSGQNNALSPLCPGTCIVLAWPHAKTSASFPTVDMY